MAKIHKHVVQMSGGIGSFCAAQRVVEKHGKENVTLLFADTLMEDPDLYRFLDDCVRFLGCQIVRLCYGLTPMQLMEKKRMIGNTLKDPCSLYLKRQMLDRWRDANCKPEESTMYIGFDWNEEHRLVRLQKYVAPWRYEAPMISPPMLLKEEMVALARSVGIEPPRLYAMGFAHNNCGGFCIKAGQAQFKLLLDKFPERYAEAEEWEEAMRSRVGDRSILRQKKKKKTYRLTLKTLRERVQANPDAFDKYDFGGCGCALPSDKEMKDAEAKRACESILSPKGSPDEK